MEAMEINGGRFYARPLHDDDRIDDRPALAEALGGHAEDFVPTARADWASDRRYTWAIAEQTCVDMLALAELTLPTPDAPAQLIVTPVGDPERVLPNDPVLTPKSVSDAATEGESTIRRWAEGFLGIQVP